MMMKGNAGLGKKGMQNNIGFREALKLSQQGFAFPPPSLFL